MVKCSCELALSNSVIVLLVSTVVSKEINRIGGITFRPTYVYAIYGFSIILFPLALLSQ